MQHTEKNIRIIGDRLSRTGIGWREMDVGTILASYGINKFSYLCTILKVIAPVQ